MNKNQINAFYKNLIYPDKDKFIKEAKEIQREIDFSSITKGPVLVIGDFKTKPLYFLFCIYFSKNERRILNYINLTATTWHQNQFKNIEEKNYNFQDKVLFGDITFIKFGISEKIKPYLQQLVLNVIEERETNNRRTVVYVDSKYVTYSKIKKLKSHFKDNNYSIIDVKEKRKTSGRKKPKRKEQDKK